MDKVRVFWSKDRPIEKAIKVDEKQYEYLYMILAKKKLLYIGQAFNQYLGNRLSRHEVLNEILDDYSEEIIRIRFGNIIAPQFSRITKKLVTDIESVLINYHDPPYNIQSTDTYYGRDIQVTNLGTFKPLKKVIRYYNEECEHEDEDNTNRGTYKPQRKVIRNHRKKYEDEDEE
jgi:hypothetical protein